MLMLTRHLPLTEASNPSRPPASILGEVRLDYDQRQKRRARFPLSDGPRVGDMVGLDLPRGLTLREGDLLLDEPGLQAVRVRAAIQQLLQVRSANWLLISRLAYHLGNRHVPLAVMAQGGEGVLRLQLDHVLEQMVQGLGGQTEVVNASFDPEQGAYHAHGAEHSHGPQLQPDTPATDVQFDRRHSPIIHDFLDPNAAPVKR
jgi:urease accessory protein